jgi:hypothetical protein
MEDNFWNLYRGAPAAPTNLQYTRALQRSLRAAGLPEAQVQQAVRAAIRERVNYGLLGGMDVHATERDAPKDRDPIDWNLVTDLPVACKADAIQMLEWYALRWKIELFHNVLKSGCRAEDSKLRSSSSNNTFPRRVCLFKWAHKSRRYLCGTWRRSWRSCQ